MDNDNNHEQKRKFYRKYIRPGYRSSMVSSQTDAKWKRRAMESSHNALVRSQREQGDEELDNVFSDSSDSSHHMEVETSSSANSRRESESDEFSERYSNDDNSPEGSSSGNSINEENGEQLRNEPLNNEDEIDYEESNNEDSENEQYDSDIDDALPAMKYPWENRFFFPQSGLTIRDSVGMVRGFSLRFNLSLEARLAMVNLLKLCAGPEFDNLNLSNYVMSRMFDTADNKITFCFYCPACKKVLNCRHKQKIANPELLCDKCGSRCNISTMTGKYFLMVDLKYQIERLFMLRKVKTALWELYTAQQRGNAVRNSITDVQDGILYNKVNPNNLNNVLTINFFLDGAILKRSGSESFWASLVQLNELPIPLRFKYIMLAGVMMTDKEPKPDLMNCFLEQFIEQVESLSTEGIVLEFGNERVRFIIKPFCAVVDSVARPILQNRLQYNGYCSCSWCYQEGVFVKGVRFPFDPNIVLRSHESHLEDLYNVERRQQGVTNIRNIRNTFVNGVKGYSSLLALTVFFDIVWSFPLEYMHCVLIGVVEQLWEIWIKNGFLSARDVENINRLMTAVETILENHRLPRSFATKSKWKASEWRSWLLFFSIPFLRDYLPADCLEHFSLLVNTVFTLLKTEITDEELIVCETDMIQFVGQFEIFYGQEQMTFNVHTLLHIVESVRRSGPLWATSAFSFESHLHVLKQYVLGSKKPEQQMAKKALDILHFKFETSTDIFHSEIAKQYCQRIFSYNPLSTYVIGSPYGVTFCGRSTPVEIINPTNNQAIIAESFKKCIYQGCVYKSIQNTLSSKRNDTVVKLICGQVVQILDIIKTDMNCYLSTVQMITVPDTLVRHILKVVARANNTILIPINDISCKIMRIDCEACVYVCHLPQTIEIQ